MHKYLFLFILLISKSAFPDTEITQKQVNSSEEGPYCEYNFSVNEQHYTFSKFDSCGSSQAHNVGGNYYLLELSSGHLSYQTYFLMHSAKKLTKKAELDIAYDKYYYGFDIINTSKSTDFIIDEKVNINNKQDINAILYFLGLLDRKSVIPDTIKSKIFTWNKDNNICDSTIISLNHYKNAESVICKSYLSSEYKYYYIKNKNIEIELSGEFNGNDFIFKNGHYQYIVNAKSGLLTVKKNGAIIAQKNKINHSVGQPLI